MGGSVGDQRIGIIQIEKSCEQIYSLRTNTLKMQPQSNLPPAQHPLKRSGSQGGLRKLQLNRLNIRSIHDSRMMDLVPPLRNFAPNLSPLAFFAPIVPFTAIQPASGVSIVASGPQQTQQQAAFNLSSRGQAQPAPIPCLVNNALLMPRQQDVQNSLNDSIDTASQSRSIAADPHSESPANGMKIPSLLLGKQGMGMAPMNDPHKQVGNFAYDHGIYQSHLSGQMNAHQPSFSQNFQSNIAPQPYQMVQAHAQQRGPPLTSSRTEYAHSPGRQSQFSHQTMPVVSSFPGGLRSSGTFPPHAGLPPQNLGSAFQGPKQVPSLLQKPQQVPPSKGQSQFQFNRTLHESQVAVRLRAHNREEFTQSLNIKIALHAASNASQQQTLVIDLTDSEDPLFLYQMCCTETDFTQLKTEQQLHVDFQAFPSNLVELLTFCQQNMACFDDHASSASSMMGAQSKFIAVFDTGVGGADAALSIVETNQFKALTYLSLSFRKANDEALKKHLAEKLKEARGSLQNATAQNAELIQKVHEGVQEREQMQGELAQAREEVRRVSDAMQIDNQKALNELREKMLLEQAEMQARFDAELKDGRSRHEHSQTDLQKKFDLLQVDHQAALDKRRDLETQLREITQALDRKEYELNLAQNELKELRTGNQQLDQMKYSQEKSITEQHVTIQSLKRELQSKEDHLTQSQKSEAKWREEMQAMVTSLQDQGSQLADTNAVYKSQITKMEEKLEESKQEIVKGNSIISKQQAEYKQLKQKLKLKIQQMGEQERATQAKQDEVGSQMKLVQELREKQIQQQKDYELQKVELSELQTVNQTLKAKLAEAQESLKSNGDLITYLNKQLNEKPGGSSLGGTGLMSTTASSSFGGKLTKPPMSTSAMGGPPASTFKPSFTSLEKLNAGAAGANLQRSSSRQSFDRQASPLGSQRSLAASVATNPTAPTQPQATSSVTTGLLASSRLNRNAHSPSTKSFPATTSSLQGSNKKVAEESPSRAMPALQTSTMSTEQPRMPTQFVSRITKMLYEQQMKDAQPTGGVNSSIPQPTSATALPRATPQHSTVEPSMSFISHTTAGRQPLATQHQPLPSERTSMTNQGKELAGAFAQQRQQLPPDFLSEEMSMCEQSFHFSNAGGAGVGKITLPSEYGESQFNETQGQPRTTRLLADIGQGKQGMLFANLDDAKTLSQADATQQVNAVIGESNETKMSENEAFLAYCKQNDDDNDDE